MIDVFMISILVALVQFGAVVTIAPGVGAVAFAAVVILTMFAAEAFDPRLMWDAAREEDRSMSAVAQSEAAVVRAKVDARRRLSPIWAIPIVSVLIAGWLVWDTLSKRGR